jgi:hypothetical protein
VGDLVVAVGVLLVCDGGQEIARQSGQRRGVLGQVGQGDRLPAVGRCADPGREQLGDWPVEPDLLATGHLGQQGGDEHLGNRPDLEHRACVRRAGHVLSALPVAEAEALVADEQADDQPDVPRRAEVSFGQLVGLPPPFKPGGTPGTARPLPPV